MSDERLDIVERLRISDYMLTIEAADVIESLRASLGQTTVVLDALTEQHLAGEDYQSALRGENDRLRALLSEALPWLADPGTDGKRLRELVARIMAEVMQVDALLVDGGEEA